jgi:hypothetical protein
MKEFKRMIYRKNQTLVSPIVNCFCIDSIIYNNTNTLAVASIVIIYSDTTPDLEYNFTVGQSNNLPCIDTNVSGIILQWNDNSLTSIDVFNDLYPFLNTTVNFEKSIDENFDFILLGMCI